MTSELTIKHTIELNCVTDKYRDALYKCLNTDDSLKKCDMYKKINSEGENIYIEIHGTTLQDIRYKAKNIYEYIHFFFKTIEAFEN